MSYIIATCKNDDCGWTATVAKLIPATRESPPDVDMDPPEECPECGAEIDTELASYPIEEPDPPEEW